MRENAEMSRGIFYIIVAMCATIIMMNSIEAIMKTKDTGLFEMWLSNPDLNTELIGQSKSEMYSTYLTMCLSTFFVRIVTPMGLAIHSYFALTKIGINKLFVYIWTLLLIGSLIFSIIGETLFSIFFVISGICYVVLIAIILYLIKIINYRRML